MPTVLLHSTTSEKQLRCKAVSIHLLYPTFLTSNLFLSRTTGAGSTSIPSAIFTNESTVFDIACSYYPTWMNFDLYGQQIGSVGWAFADW